MITIKCKNCDKDMQNMSGDSDKLRTHFWCLQCGTLVEIYDINRETSWGREDNWFIPKNSSKGV